jgi:hypothetical protein
VVGLLVAVKAEAEAVRILPLPEGAEDAIPDRENARKVGVGLGDPSRMVHPVHLRSDNQPAEGPVERGGEAEVGVVKQRGGHEQGLVEQDVPHFQAKGGRGSDHHHRLHQHISGVEAEGGRGVWCIVVMVNGVEPPQEGDVVRGNVPGIAEQVEAQDRNDRDHPRRQRFLSEQAETARARRFGYQDEGRGKECGAERTVCESEGDVAKRVARARSTQEERDRALSEPEDG